MSLTVEVFKCDNLLITIDVSPVTLFFIDTFRAELARDCGSFDHFQYEDEDGDLITVRCDDDMQPFMEKLLASQCIRIFIVDNCIEEVEDIPVILPSHLRHISIIANGQFGTVYKSLHILTDRVIAVKCVNIDDSDDVREGIGQELDLLQKCSMSEFVVDLLGKSIDGSTLSICMEYMDGGALSDYGILPVDVLPPICISVFEGLQALWQMNIMHRDLKPANILVNTNGFVKLSDFGVSKKLDQSIARTYIGTSVYMAPERINGGTYRLTSDIWAFGLCAWEMAIGRFPLQGDETEGITMIINRICRNPIVVPTLAGHPEALRRMIKSCLQKDVDNRWSIPELDACEYIRCHRPLDRSIIARHVREHKVLE